MTPINDRLAKRNVAILAYAQAVLGSQLAIQIILGGLAGAYLASDPSLATLPISITVLVSMFTAPAADFVQAAAWAGTSGHFAAWRSRVRGLPEFAGELPVAALAACLALAAPARAQMQMIIPFPAGGARDILGRLIQPEPGQRPAAEEQRHHHRRGRDHGGGGRWRVALALRLAQRRAGCDFAGLVK